MGDAPAVQWLRVGQAARIIGVSRWTMAANAAMWNIRTKVFPTPKGGETRYHSGDVARFADQSES